MANHSHILSEPTFKLASEPGALDGWKISCSCGFVQGTSLGPSEALKLGHAHVEYMLRKEQGGRR